MKSMQGKKGRQGGLEPGFDSYRVKNSEDDDLVWRELPLEGFRVQRGKELFLSPPRIHVFLFVFLLLLVLPAMPSVLVVIDPWEVVWLRLHQAGYSQLLGEKQGIPVLIRVLPPELFMKTKFLKVKHHPASVDIHN